MHMGLCNATNILSTILQNKLDSVTLNAFLTPSVTSFKISLGFRLQGDVVACGVNKFGDPHKMPPQPKKTLNFLMLRQIMVNVLFYDKIKVYKFKLNISWVKYV
jgi:hypothetical protein